MPNKACRGSFSDLDRALLHDQFSRKNAIALAAPFTIKYRHNAKATMNHYRSIYRIVLTSSLIVTASATAARSEFHDPSGIHNAYKPFQVNGPHLIVPAPTKLVNGGSPGHADGRIAQRITPSLTERFDDLNLSVILPGGSWTKLDPKTTGSRACLLLSRQNPEITLSLAGEPECAEANNTNATLLAESQAKMKRMPGAVLSSATDLSAGVIDGKLYEATIGEGQAKAHYAIWVAAHHGYNYKLAVYGDQKARPTIDAAIRTFVYGIKHIEPTKLAYTGARPTITNAKLTNAGAKPPGPSAKPTDITARVAERKRVAGAAAEIQEHSLLRSDTIRR